LWSGLRPISYGRLYDLGCSDVTRFAAVAEHARYPSFGVPGSRRASFELDVATHNAQSHGGQPPQSRAIKLTHLDWLVGGTWLIRDQQAAQSPGNIVGIGRRSFDIALESNGTKVERGAAGIVFVDPAVGRPSKKVRDKEGNALVDPEGIESWIALDAMELDHIVGLYKGQDADLWVAVCRTGNQRPVPHFSHKSFSGSLVGRIVGTSKHLASLASRCDAISLAGH
jgi:hypothetical protein